MIKINKSNRDILKAGLQQQPAQPEPAQPEPKTRQRKPASNKTADLSKFFAPDVVEALTSSISSNIDEQQVIDLINQHATKETTVNHIVTIPRKDGTQHSPFISPPCAHKGEGHGIGTGLSILAEGESGNHERCYSSDF